MSCMHSVLVGVVGHICNTSTVESGVENVDFEARLGMAKLSQNQTKP